VATAFGLPVNEQSRRLIRVFFLLIKNDRQRITSFSSFVVQISLECVLL